jgi:hypothetical protein
LPSTEQGAERTEQPNIARCSVQFGNISCAPVRFGCSVRHISRGCCSALVLGYVFLQKFSNFVRVLKKRISEHVFPVWV